MIMTFVEEPKIGDLFMKGRSFRQIQKTVGRPVEIVVYRTMTQRNQIANRAAWDHWARTAVLASPGTTGFMEGRHAG